MVVHLTGESNDWGARIRTWECRYQKPVPYRLATPHRDLSSAAGKARRWRVGLL